MSQYKSGGFSGGVLGVLWGCSGVFWGVLGGARRGLLVKICLKFFETYLKQLIFRCVGGGGGEVNRSQRTSKGVPKAFSQ